MFFFFFNDTATTEIYTLSLHDALPISPGSLRRVWQDRSAEARELCQVRGDLRRVYLPRVVTHDAETVVQRDGGAVHARKPLQGEPCGRGTAAARHLGDVKPNGGRVWSLGRNA